MLPKSSKHYILPTAADLNLNPQLVEDVVAFYYSKLRNSLSNLDFYQKLNNCNLQTRVFLGS